MLNSIEEFLDKRKERSLNDIENELIKIAGQGYEKIIQDMFKEFADFVFIDPKIPYTKKNYIVGNRLNITIKDSREEIMNLIAKNQKKSEAAILALYVYRQMDEIDWRPFIKAAIERNPVSLTVLDGKNSSEVYSILNELPDESIYDGKRLALPDEVWNFRRGDGIEKAFLLADFILHDDKSSTVSINIENKKVLLSAVGNEFHFTSHKNMTKSIRIKGKDYTII